MKTEQNRKNTVENEETHQQQGRATQRRDTWRKNGQGEELGQGKGKEETGGEQAGHNMLKHGNNGAERKGREKQG